MTENEKVQKTDRVGIAKTIEERENIYSKLAEKLRLSMIKVSELKDACKQSKKALLEKITPVVPAVEVEKPTVLEQVTEETTSEDKVIPDSIMTYTVDDFTKPQPTKTKVTEAPEKVEEGKSKAKETTTEEGSGKKKNVPTEGKKHTVDDKKKLSKKAKVQKGYEKNIGSVEYDEISGEIKKVRVRKSSIDKDKKKVAPPQITVIEHAVLSSENITIKTA